MKLNLDLVMALLIILVFLVICYKYNYIESIETFENENNINNVPNVNTVQPEPDSKYNLQQYIQSNPPTGSRVVRREISHTLPDLMDSDITMGQEKQIRFGSMRGEVGSDNDSFYLQGVSDASEPHLKMVLGDKDRKNASFQIYGGACSTHGNCSLDGRQLYNFDSRPNFTIKDRRGNVIHTFSDEGNYTASGELKGTSVRTDNNATIGRDLTTNRNTRIKGNLTIDGTVTANGRRIDQEVEIPDVDVNNAGNHKANQYYATGNSNVKDANVRGRIYFSQAGENDNPRDIISSNYNKWSSIHNTDAMYIEKVRNNRIYSYKDVVVGPSNGRNKLKDVAINWPGWTVIGVSDKPVNAQNSTWRDTFAVKLTNNKTKLRVERIDLWTGWAQPLTYRVYGYKHGSTDNSIMRVVLSDDYDDSFEIWHKKHDDPHARIAMRVDGHGNLFTRGRIYENANL